MRSFSITVPVKFGKKDYQVEALDNNQFVLTELDRPTRFVLELSDCKWKIISGDIGYGKDFTDITLEMTKMLSL